MAGNIFADFKRIYAVLPSSLQRETWKVFACVLLQAILEVGAILGISFLAMSIAAPERLLSQEIISKFFRAIPWLEEISKEPRLFSMMVAAAAALLIASKNGITAWVTLITAKLGERIALFTGEVVFQSFLWTPYIQHLAGDSRAMFQALSWRDQLGRMIIHLMSVYTYAIVSLSMAITLFCFTPGIILLVMIVMGALAVGVYKSIRASIDKCGIEVAEWNRSETSATMNAMSGIRETLIYRQQDVFFESFRNACVAGVPSRSFLGLAPSIPTWVLETAGFIILLVTLWIMYVFLDASMARIAGVLTMIMLISWRVLPLLNRSLTALVVVRSTRHAALDCLAKLEEALHNPMPAPSEPVADFTLRESIAFQRVGFRYPSSESECLSDMTFTIPYGSRVGIVGQSGAGKSSIAIILSGLVEPSRGDMLVDGKVLSAGERAAYCQQVGYVAQSPYILAGTLAENIAFSEWGKPWDEERVLKACRMAELDVAQTRGINMSLGQDGSGLSGGQAQRLSIARALYANPSILILDEATSSLDTGVEGAIMNTIFALPQNITTIIIAHRLSTVERCDTLIWVDNGTVRLSGTPSDVLPHYQKFLEQKSMERLAHAVGHA